MTHRQISSGKLQRHDRPALAYRQTIGRGPTIVFLPGYASDMAGSKASAMIDWATANGRSCLLFDYSGCGQSGGEFADETLETWRDDVLDIIAARCDALSPLGEARENTSSPLVLIGSSMGGWLMLLAALALGERIVGLVGIAAAPDFTQWGYSDAEQQTLQRDGQLLRHNPYGPEPTLTTLALWQSGQRHLVLASPIAINCPVELLHGQSDADVPFAIALQLAQQLCSDAVRVQLIKDGDHRLSRPADIARLIATVADLTDRIKSP